MSLAEFIYTVVLKPKPLRKFANFVIKRMIPETVRYGHVDIVLNPKDPVVSGALAFRQYEHDELDFVFSALRPGMIILDVGANIGLYTAVCAHQCGISGRVIALEPDPENHSFLKKTISRNGFKNVQIVQAAAGRQAGELTLYTSTENRGDNRLYANNLADGSISVKVLCLDEALPQLDIQRLDFIKIDVQGFEGEVIAGLEKTIRRSLHVAILMEFWPFGLIQAGCDPLELLERLKSWGMDIHELKKGAKTASIQDFTAFINRYPGRKYTNLVLRHGQ